MTKLNPSISGGDLADIFYASVIGTGRQNMPDFLSSQCAELTPFLSGDAIKDYPNLAAAWYSGKNVLWQNGYFSFQLAWDRAKLQSQDPDFRPRIVAPFAFDGGTAAHLLGSTSDSLTVFRRASDDRIRELLGIVNFMVAPFGTREYLLLNYGVQDRDFTFASTGNPTLSQVGMSEVTTFPIWKMSAPPPVRARQWRRCDPRRARASLAGPREPPTGLV